MPKHDLFEIDPAVRSELPEIQVAMGVLKGATVTISNPAVDELVHEGLAKARLVLGNGSIAQHSRVQGFRQIYRKFGVDPGQRRPSAEALASRAKDPAKRFPRINTVVDTYNISSVEMLLPMAAYDLRRVSPPITLRFAAAGEEHLGIGEQFPTSLAAGELVYADAAMVLCRDFNYRDADLTKVTEATQDLVVFVDGCASVTRDDLAAALELVCQRLTLATGAAVEATRIFP